MKATARKAAMTNAMKTAPIETVDSGLVDAAKPTWPRRVVQTMAVLCVCGWLAACDNNDGPAERAGERVDEVSTDVGNAVEDKCEEMKEGAGAEDADC